MNLIWFTKKDSTQVFSSSINRWICYFWRGGLWRHRGPVWGRVPQHVFGFTFWAWGPAQHSQSGAQHPEDSTVESGNAQCEETAGHAQVRRWSGNALCLCHSDSLRQHDQQWGLTCLQVYYGLWTEPENSAVQDGSDRHVQFGYCWLHTHNQ